MIGGLLSLLSAITFAYANASVRRGVLTGTVLQAVAISLPIALPFFILAMLPIGGFAALMTFSTRTIVLLVLAGILHFAVARYFTIAQPRRSAPIWSRRSSNTVWSSRWCWQWSGSAKR